MTNLRVLLWNVLAFGALPAWLLAGFADWLCHRRSKIEITSGSRESAMHLLLHLEIAAPLLAALWLEINAGPERLDLGSVMIRTAKSKGARFTISTDAHWTQHLDFMRYGVITARRGWLGPSDILNTLPADQFAAALQKES